MTQLKYRKPSPLRKRALVVAETECDLDEIKSVFVSCWHIVYQLKNELDASALVEIVLEIWLDTGRVIWIVKEERDLFRFALTISNLEVAYYRLPEGTRFDRAYKSLLDQIRVGINLSINEIPDYVQRLVVRDSDDASSEVTQFP
jgi:hypothetical protein